MKNIGGSASLLGSGRMLAVAASMVLVLPAAASVTVSDEIPASRTAELRLEQGSLLLTIDEAISLALERNLSLVVQRHVREESELSLWRSRGIYDTSLAVDLGAFSETSPTASNLEAGIGQDVQEQDGENWNVSLNRLFPSGGRGSLTWNNRRFESNSIFLTLNPSYRVDFDLAFSQPLLRDQGRATTDYQIQVARTNVDISEENFELQVVQTLQAVADAYWTLVEAKAQLAVAEESLALAKQLHEQNRIRVDVGTMAPLELVQSEAGVATREEGIIRARAAVGDREDLVRQLLNLEAGPLWETEIIPETDPNMDPVPIDLEAGLASALSDRAELRSKRLGQEILELAVDFFRNQEKPRLDLSVVYGVNGLGGDITQRDFLTGNILFQAPGNYGDALDQVTDTEFDGWQVALNMAYPLGNRAGKAQRALAEVNLERGSAELRDLELGVATEVRRLARVVETAAQARESARVSRVLEEKNLDAEQKRYENGMSTSFRVLQIQEDLSEARSREVTSITAYRRALVQYYRAIGRLPEESGVEVVAGGE